MNTKGNRVTLDKSWEEICVMKVNALLEAKRGFFREQYLI